MKLINILKNLLLENDAQREFGCVMLYFNFPQLRQIQKNIKQEDIYEFENPKYGLERDPHITLLYGLHKEVTSTQVNNKIKGLNSNPVTLFNCSCFNNEKYDVLKFDANGSNLHQIHNQLKTLPNSNEYPDYHPHMTVGYLNPGAGEKYVNEFKGLQFELIPTKVVFSTPEGKKYSKQL